MSRFQGKPIKVLNCPSCNKYGLQTRKDKYSNIKVRCKLCNAFWDGEEAFKLHKTIIKLKAEAVIKSNKKRVEDEYNAKNIQRLVKKGFLIFKVR